MSDTYGIVVVGLGIAGKVRIRDILEIEKCSPHEELEGIQLLGHASRREVSIEGSQQVKFEDILEDENVKIIIICTENELHEDLTRKAIEAGKHVLVEFPLALDAVKARELLDLAKEKGVVCYEEDISLLSDQHLYVKELVKEKPNLVSGKSWLAGRFNGWIEDPIKSGSAFHSSIPQIHRLLDIFGDLTAVDAKIVKTEKSIVTEGTVKTKDIGLVDINIQREVLDKPKRDTGFILKFSDGSEIDSKTLSKEPNKPGLFLRDLIQFMSVVKKRKDATEIQNLVIKGIEIADELYELAKKNPESKL